LFSSSEALDLDYSILSMDVGSLGIPEFGTKFVRQMLQDTRPKAFSELVRISGFSHGTDVWINNAQELIINKTAKLSDAISTRDDIMSYLLHKELEPIIAFRIMEDVRKGKGLKPEYEKDMRDHEVPTWYIDSCKKIKYMFPKAHAVAYVTMAFRIAWYKINYPEAFYATYFTVRADEFDLEIIRQGPRSIKNELKKLNSVQRLSAREKNVETILEIAQEMYARGIELLPMDLYQSDACDFIVDKKSLLPPFNTIPGLGLKAAKNIVDVRENDKIMSIEDLRLRSRISTTVVDKMREMGMLEGLPESEQMSLFV
jgi:DNA polymerase-3 subunit alpha (Gram-positive type)